MNTKDKNSLGDLLGLDFPDDDLPMGRAMRRAATYKEKTPADKPVEKVAASKKRDVKAQNTRKTVAPELKNKARSKNVNTGKQVKQKPAFRAEDKRIDRVQASNTKNGNISEPGISENKTNARMENHYRLSDLFLEDAPPGDDVFDLNIFNDSDSFDFTNGPVVYGKDIKLSENKNDPNTWLLRPKKYRWIMETFRTFKTKLRNSDVIKNKKVFLLTGAEGKVGVSTVTYNLGMIFGWDLSDKKILIIDGNVRFPSLHKVFSFVDQKSGILNLLLEDDVTIENALHQMNDPNVYLMPLGKTKKDILSPFDMDHFNEVLHELKNRFDYIFIDSAPALWSNHTRILSTKTDGVILVAEANRTRFEVVMEAKRQLESDGAELIGGFLNKRRFVIPKWIYRFI